MTVKVNVSSENGNRAFLMPYPKFQGVPHMFVLDADGKLLQSQDTDNLEKGNGYNADRMRDFLTKWKPS